MLQGRFGRAKPSTAVSFHAPGALPTPTPSPPPPAFAAPPPPFLPALISSRAWAISFGSPSMFTFTARLSFLLRLLTANPPQAGDGMDLGGGSATSPPKPSTCQVRCHFQPFLPKLPIFL